MRTNLLNVDQNLRTAKKNSKINKSVYLDALQIIHPHQALIQFNSNSNSNGAKSPTEVGEGGGGGFTQNSVGFRNVPQPPTPPPKNITDSSRINNNLHVNIIGPGAGYGPSTNNNAGTNFNVESTSPAS